MEGGYEAMRKLLLEEGPSAVFCCSDDMAIGAIKAANDLGYTVPEDVSLIGFDDIRFSAYLSPALTTVRRPIELLSRTGAEQLLQMLEQKEVKRQTTLFTHTELVMRHSVRNLAQHKGEIAE
jgi:LacI family transcriptional regulator